MTRAEQRTHWRTIIEDLPRCRYELDFHTPLELLVATILSAQCTDQRVN